MSMHDLPPLPSYLKNAMAMSFSENSGSTLLSNSTENGNRQGARQSQGSRKKRRSVSPKCTQTKTKLERQIELMRSEMMQLKAMDKSLLEQFYVLHENIQELKQDRISETASECSSASYSTDTHLESISDYNEHIYVNEKFHTHVYENVQLNKTSFSRMSRAEEGGVYEPMYLQPQCHTKKTSKQNATVPGRHSKSASSRKSEQPGSQSQTVPADRKASSGKLKKQSSKRLSGVFSQTTYESSC